MVINEKGLIKAMKETWKGPGYKVAVEAQGGVDQIMIAGPGWMVVYDKEHLPRKVLGMIAEHLGTIPEAGEAYQVAKDRNQTEIFDVAMSGLNAIRKNQEKKQQISKTALTLNGNAVWQRHEDKRVVMVDPGLEDILSTHGRIVHMIGEEILVVYGAVSWGYIDTAEDNWMEFDEKIDHLSQIPWVAI